VLDACVFMQAANLYYAFDIAPRFWDQLIEHASNGRLISIDRVGKEIIGDRPRQKDRLAKWAKSEFHQWFKPTDREDVVEAYREVMEWVKQHPRYTPAAKAEFAKVADGWLVAFAKVEGCTLVTQEKPEPESKRKVKIPDVCEHFGVPWIDTFEMLRRLGVKFD